MFSSKHTLERNEREQHWLDRNHDNVSEWSDMSTRGVLFQCASTIQIQLSVLVLYKLDIIIISSNVTYFRHDMAGILFI
jgi:hypothetical protein